MTIPMSASAVDFIKAFSGYLWPAVALMVAVMFKEPLLRRLAHVTEVEFMGLRVVLASAVEAAGRAHGRPVSRRESDAVADRLSRNAELVRGLQILWIDDNHASTRHERDAMAAAGMVVETVTDTAEAVQRLRRDSFALVISDIDRDGDPEAGLHAMPQLHAYRPTLPIIFYIGRVNPERGTPAGAFGVTNAPSELLHLVLDVVERRDR